MIEKKNGLYFAVCDRCKTALVGCEKFLDAVETKKKAGWRAWTTDAGWQDHCKGCITELKLIKQGHRAGEGLRKR